MATLTVEELYEKYVKPLPPEQRLRLLSLAASETVGDRKVCAGRKWSEIAGTAPYPLVGEDAQEWVSRTREESDRGREIPR